MIYSSICYAEYVKIYTNGHSADDHNSGHLVQETRVDMFLVHCSGSDGRARSRGRQRQDEEGRGEKEKEGKGGKKKKKKKRTR